MLHDFTLHSLPDLISYLVMLIDIKRIKNSG